MLSFFNITYASFPCVTLDSFKGFVNSIDPPMNCLFYKGSAAEFVFRVFVSVRPTLTRCPSVSLVFFFAVGVSVDPDSQKRSMLNRFPRSQHPNDPIGVGLNCLHCCVEFTCVESSAFPRKLGATTERKR